MDSLPPCDACKGTGFQSRVPAIYCPACQGACVAAPADAPAVKPEA